ncbi:hypothetical protein [Pseudonocardia pini]|uniref:hypothetical protein n=1 Tax=Pseudonocardia pini TaxID=2758030 RepID=UPI0015EFFAE1|nr:hypothetical protein [Pseudonocardia pini]
MDDTMDSSARSATAGHVFCTVCSGPRTKRDEQGLAWSSHHVGGSVSWVCGPCTRAHIFEIETGQPLTPLDLRQTA